jgi:hypothetical protein
MVRQGILLSAIALLVLAATSVGIFYSTEEPDIQGVSLRGQAVVYQGAGIYRYNPVFFVREGVIWDHVNLFVTLPLFILASIFAARGSMKARLFLSGLLAYLWYVYLGTVMMNAFNNLFLMYVGVIALTPIAFISVLRGIRVSSLPESFSDRFPRRLFAAFFLLLALVLAGLWMLRIISVMRTGLFPPEYAGLLTLGSQALDLGLLVPLALGAALLLIRRSAWGYLLAAVGVPFGLMMFISIPLWATVPLIQDGTTNLVEAVPFYLLSLAGIALAIVFVLSIKRPDRHKTSLDPSPGGSARLRT